MKKVLDSFRLPSGVLVPMVNDVATARAVVAATRYPPLGVRGCAIPLVRASSYGSIPTEEYLTQSCREDLLVMVQVETLEGICVIEEIGNVEGVDAIFLGPLDISASIGKLGTFEDPEFQRLMSDAERRVRENGDQCLLAGFRTPGRSLEEMFSDTVGYSLVCGSVDIGLIRDAAIQDAQAGMKAICGG